MSTALASGSALTAGLLSRVPASSPDPGDLGDAQKVYDHAYDLMVRGEHDLALPLAERALALHDVALGPQHPGVVRCLELLGGLALWQGDGARAESHLHRALTVRELMLGPMPIS